MNYLFSLQIFFLVFMFGQIAGCGLTATNYFLSKNTHKVEVNGEKIYSRADMKERLYAEARSLCPGGYTVSDLRREESYLGNQTLTAKIICK